MLIKAAAEGVLAACQTFGVDPDKLAMAALPGAAPAGLFARGMDWLRGQGSAAKSLVHNVRGGFGGKFNPEIITGTVPGQSTLMAQGAHRSAAMGNLKTLAPSMLAIGGLGVLNHMRNKNQEQAAQQQGRY